MTFEVGDLVLCTVDRIVGTVVFVKIDSNGSEIEGSIVMSEIAPGRIRNIRTYVVPKKKIVCKILRISQQGNIELSLRRVTQKEKKEVMEQAEQEKNYKGILKGILKEKADGVIKQISQEKDIFSFLEEAKTNSKKLEKIVGKEDAKKITDILNSQKKKKRIIKKEINLTTTKPDGITLIKKMLGMFKGVNIKYISAGRYSLEIESDDIKKADKEMKEMMDSIEKESKKSGFKFSVR